jgi:uncharacterized protein YndB with AHSA1/START domain
MTAVVPYDGTFVFPASPEQVWAAIEQFDRYEAWWSWLSDFRAAGARLEPGTRLSGTVAPPLPYRMRVEVTVLEAARPGRLLVDVSGDLVGRATLRLSPHADGTEATVAWQVEMMQRPMRLAARVAYPVLRWGHDRVVDLTVAGFRRHLRALR